MSAVIQQIEMGKANSYLIEAKNGYILVDAGMPDQVDIVSRFLSKKNADLEDIILIIITHVHYDHVGSLAALKEKTNAEVLVHKKEKELLENGKTEFPEGTVFISKIISKLSNLISESKFKAVTPDITVDDYYDLKQYGIKGEIIHTPGHTGGSISVIINGEDIICGDTLFNFMPHSVYPPFANNKDELIESWQKIKSYNCKRFYPGHGSIFTEEKFIKTLEKKLQ
ncbi:MBL fold metallo-hydrolase [Halanaerobium kushneri]|uniref:Glyoxylase, beta-lactamase superfamily II n=1 Tax=Halanaerobium kushneri TaxID=56779 RepID=A0A1N6YTW3_9FIRM|nr:MBL fold metallo-hydrolase [Halanaerobium kushneri]SIR17841.1 Glyoxylase, beta-lactamase superfamily II [Halanaerobium kushneri]